MMIIGRRVVAVRPPPPALVTATSMSGQSIPSGLELQRRATELSQSALNAPKNGT
jgi:hypothetical protein